MNPGYELDTLVAEKVMGWQKFIFSTPIRNLQWGWAHKEGCLESEIQKVTPYSADISSAWEVVEKLRSMGYSVDVVAYPEDRLWLKPPYDKAPAKEWILTKDELQYQCRISKFDPDYYGWISWADPRAKTPAHAICLAALETIDRESEKS